MFSDIYAFLDAHHIIYQRFDHAAVYTCEQASALLPDIPGTPTKNLLLCDERKRKFYFVMAAEDKRIDLKQLGQQLGAGKGLRFAPPECLRQYLGVEAGAVTALAIINDVEVAVAVLVDRDLWQAESLHCHPLVNTSTLVITRPDLARVFELSGHPVQVIDLPTR